MDTTSKSYDRKKILYLGARRFSCGDRYTLGLKGDIFLELFREEVARQHDVLNWGWGYRYNWIQHRQLSEPIDFFGTPDIVLTDDFGYYVSLGILDIDAVKAHIVGDFYYGMDDKFLRKYLVIFEQYDILFAVCDSAVRLVKEHLPEKKCVFWPYSVDVNFFRNYDRDRPIDVFFGASTSGALYGWDRRNIYEMLKELYVEGLNTYPKKIYFYGYVDTLNKSKIAISNNSMYGFMPKKVLEIMACGSLLLTDKCEEFDLLGIEDGKHVVVYNDLDDLRDKIYYYLENDSEREKIALNGNKLVNSKFRMYDAVHSMMEHISSVRQ